MAVADMRLVAQVRRLAGSKVRRSELDDVAERLHRELSDLPGKALDTALVALLDRLTEGVIEAGWCPEDLAEVVRRRSHRDHVPGLAALLGREARRAPAPGPAWLEQLEGLGPQSPVRALTVEDLAVGLGLAATLADLPEVAPTLSRTSSGVAGSQPEPASAETRARLSKVRGLLAKAESTPYDEEAEALTAKAQELISQHALERLVEDGETEDPHPAVAVRRLWLDPPYVLGKAHLVDSVAGANRCRSVVAERLGMCTVVGAPEDLDAVELLVTSLLVQASSAMLGHGRHVDRGGRSRTRSFRKSFLISFAARIGERLRQATENVLRDSGDQDRLLPVLRSEEARVHDAFAELFPQVRQRETHVSNGAGWTAGHAAADLARLEVHDQVTG